MDDFNELNALRGFSPRQQRLLDLEAHADGTAYEDLAEWTARGAMGEPLPCCARKPSVQVGLIPEKVTKLTRRLSGAGNVPAFDGVDEIKDALAELRIDRTLPTVARDVVIKGAGAIGFARIGNAATGRFEPLFLDPVWCEPVFVAQAASARARQIAGELAAAGVPLTAPAPGDALFAPEDADSHDLCFLRHEWRHDEEIAATTGGAPRQTRSVRRRRDYLPNVIVDYEPVEILADTDTAPEWQVAGKPRPHGWGVVPIVWIRSPLARAGSSEGPSFITPEIESIAEAVDYTQSMANDSVRAIAWPKLALIDLKDRVQELNRELGVLAPKPSSSSAEVMELRSSGSVGGRVQILEPTGEGPKLAANHIAEMQRHVDRLTGLVDFDQAKASGTLSGVALERMMEPLVSTVSEYRGPIGDGLILLARKIGVVLKKPVSPTLRWPRVISVTPSDLLAAAQALTAATGGQAVMSRDTAARIFAQLAEIADVGAEINALNADAEAALAAARAAMPDPAPPAAPAPVAP